MKLMVIDGNSIVNRAFYGIRLLSTKDGLYTNAVYGFVNILQKLLDEDRPDALCVAFDLAAPTFRHAQYEAYKANRKGMPEELAMQMPVLKRVLDAMNVPRYELEGYEADDIIGTVSRLCEEDGWECLIVTGDKDSFQLITETTHVKHVKTRAGQTETTEYDEATFLKEYGFTPEKMTDLKALMGDSSDNIPGVAGIGEKTALGLVSRFGTLQEIYDGLDGLDVKPAVRAKLEAGKELAFLCYGLAKIDTGLDIDFRPVDNLRREADKRALYDVFAELGFSKFIEKFGLTGGEKSAAAPETEWETVADPAGLESLLERCGEGLAFFACPRSLDAFAVLAGGRAAFLKRDSFGENEYEAFVRAFFGGGVKKASHDIKQLMSGLICEGIAPDGFAFDTALGAYLLSPTDGGYELEKAAMKYLNIPLPPAKEYESAEAFGVLSSGSGEACLKAHAEAIRGLHGVLSPKLKELDMDRLFYGVELPLCQVLAEMENLGFMVDRKALGEFGGRLSDEIGLLQRRIYDYAEEEFNINSTRQLGVILFEKLMLPYSKKTKTGYSTDIEVLEKLRGKHPIVEDLIYYRQLTKLKSTYADGLMKVIARDGRIHTSFQMTATATGRLSSVEPNLQNIPVRTELGSEMRRMFIAGGEDMVLVDADYSQIELRVLAHISGDEMMRQAFLGRTDIHTVTASQVFGIAPEEVTPSQRSSAKAVNFGIVYGISDFSLAQDIGVTRAEARRYIDNYLKKYSGVREYMKAVVEQAKRDGYVTTLMGRRRYLPELKSSNFNIRSFGERVALNTPIQGTAADIIKLAMINVRNRLRSEGLRGRLIMQVHDELIAEAPSCEAEKIAAILEEEMEGAVRLRVPLVAEAKCGKSWYEAKK